MGKRERVDVDLVFARAHAGRAVRTVLLDRIAHGGVVEHFFFDERQEPESPAPAVIVVIRLAKRKMLVRIMECMQGDPVLTQVVSALRPPRSRPRALDRGKQQAGQRANDRDHDQKLNERKTV